MSCEEVIKEFWIKREGTVNLKLRSCATSLVEWNHKTNGHIPSKLNVVRSKLESLTLCDDSEQSIALK